MNLPLLAAVLILVVLAYFIWQEMGKQSSKREARRIIDEKLFLPKRMTRRKKTAPIAGICYKCGKKVTMPYKCKFCGGLFCEKHRLPEKHACPGLKKLKRDRHRS